MAASNAEINPALEALNIIAGKWELTGSHPYMPGENLKGQAIIEWIEGGAYLRMRSEIDHPKFPKVVAIIGSDNESGELTMLHFDDRKISRKYEFNVEGKIWRWWRDDRKFSQRFTAEVLEDGNTMISKGEMKRDGSDWEEDLSLRYDRIS